jgi:hypothetical protein
MSKKCKHDGYYYCAKAEEGGMKVDFNFQGHPIIKSKDGNSLMLPRNLQNASTEGLIVKWLLKFGIVIILILAMVYFL